MVWNHTNDTRIGRLPVANVLPVYHNWVSNFLSHCRDHFGNDRGWSMQARNSLQIERQRSRHVRDCYFYLMAIGCHWICDLPYRIGWPTKLMDIP